MSDGKVIYEIRADDSNLDSDLDVANKKVEGSSNKLSKAAKVTAAAIGTAFVAAGTAAIKFGTEFEQSLANASTLFGDANVDIDELSKKMLDLSSSSGVAASELGNAFTLALSSGIEATDDMSEALDFLEQNTKIAKAGFTTLETAVDVTTSVLNSYGKDVSETAKIHKVLQQTQDLGKTTVDELGASLAQVTPTASAMGVSFEQVGASLSVMTANGLSTAEATTQLNNMIAELGKSGTKASNNLTEAAKGTKYAGMSFTEMMEAGVPLNTVLDMMNGYAEDTNVSLLDMFGSIQGGKGALALAGKNSASFTKALEAMGTEVDVVGNAYEKVTGTTGQRFSKLLNELKNAAIELFYQMMPIIEELLPVLQSLLEQIVPVLSDLVQGIMPILSSFIENLLPPLLELIDVILPPLIQLFESILPPLMKIMDMILPPLIKLFETLIPPLMDILNSILPPLIDILGVFIEPLMELIDFVLPPLIQLFEGIKPILDALMPVIKTLASIFSGTLGGAIKAIMPLIETLMNIFNGLMTFITGIFTGNWEKAWEGIVNIFKGIFNLIPAIVEAVINGAITILNGIIRGINAVGGWLWGDIGLIPKVQLPRFKMGIDYVPEDEMPALLHKGEAVLTAEEATVWRGIGGLSGLRKAERGIGDSSSTRIANMNNTVTVIVPVDLDGREIARITAPYMGEQLAWEGE